MLLDEGDRALHLLRQGSAVEEDLALNVELCHGPRSHLQVGEHLEDGTLACSRRTDDGRDLTSREGGRDVVEDGLVCGAEPRPTAASHPPERQV